MATRTTPARGAGYDEDFHAWTQAQAAALRAGRFDELDLDNLAEEIESSGRSDRRQLRSRLEVLLVHLLKWRHQPEQRSGSWEASIIEQRGRIGEVLQESPSLRREVPAFVASAYARARKLARAETGLPLGAFPDACPFSEAQILDEDWLP